MRMGREWLSLLLSVNPAREGERWRAGELPEERVEGCVAVRLDGVGFGSRLAWLDCGRPRCGWLHFAEVSAAIDVCRLYGCVAAYVVSDEATLFFRPGGAAYAGRVYKLVSVLASEYSARVSLSLGMPLSYDARIVVVDDAAGYVLWRMRVAFNNYVSQLYHAVHGRRRGTTPRLEEMLEALGGRVLGEEQWRLTGSLAAALPVEVEAVDRRSGRRVVVTRRRWVRVTDPCRVVEVLERLEASGFLCGSQKYGKNCVEMPA